MNLTATSSPNGSGCPYFSRIWFENDKIPLNVFLCILNIPTAVASTLMNLLVLVSIWRTRSLHQPSFVLLFSLALSDLLVGLIVQPGFIASTVARIKGATNTQCFFLISGSVTTSTLCSVSLLTMTAISVDKYLAFTLHLRYKEVVRFRRVVFIVVMIWLSCAVTGNSFVWDAMMFSIVSIATITISNALALFTYAKIYRVVRRHESQVGAQMQLSQNWRASDKERNVVSCKKSAVTMFVVHCLFVLCFMPYFCIVLILLVSEHTAPKHSALEMSLTLVFINSFLNPIVYCWRLSEIRRAVRETLFKTCGRIM